MFAESKKTKDEIQQVIKGFKQYKKEFGKNPSKDQLSTYLGFEKIGNASKISRLTDQIKKAGIKDPFKNLKFKLGTATRDGKYKKTDIIEFKDIKKLKIVISNIFNIQLLHTIGNKSSDILSPDFRFIP